MVQRRTRPRSSASSSTDRQRARRPRRRAGEEEDPNDDNDMDLDEEEEEEEDVGEVTRCICGHQDLPAQTVKNSKVEVDTGLFIQCDLCHVWQHGCCVGFSSEEEVPDVYTCEKCRPERHVIVVRPWGKTSTYYPGGAPEYAEAKPPQEQPPPPRKRKSRSPSPPPKPHAEEGNGAANGAARRAERRQRATLNSRDYEETLQRVLDESLHDLDPRPEGNPRESSSDERSSSSRRSKRTPRPPRRAASPAETPAAAPDIDTDTSAVAAAATPSKKKRPRPRQRKPPQPKPPKHESFQESKPRIPPPRATIPELRRRVAAILEFVSRTREDAELERFDRTRLLEERNRRYSALYPAGAAPSDFPAMFEKYHATIDGMDRLSQKLARWEQLYGSYDAANDPES